MSQTLEEFSQNNGKARELKSRPALQPYIEALGFSWRSDPPSLTLRPFFRVCICWRGALSGLVLQQ